MLIPQAIVQSGGGLSQSYVGYNTVGGSIETTTTRRVYVKQITLASAGLITAVAAYVRTNNQDHASGLMGCMYSDNAGDPDLLIAFNQTTIVAEYMSKAGATAGSFRWFEMPMGIWCTAGSYWIGIQNTNSGSSSLDVKYDATGSDRFMTTGFDGIADWNGLYSPTTTANAYSIRATLLS